MSNKSWITFWHQPTDIPILGTVEQVEECLKNIDIPYELRPSEMKNHLAFAVPKDKLQQAIKNVELNFGRNV